MYFVIIYLHINENSKHPLTKRKILSEIAFLFNPLGLIGPVVTRAKIIMQKMWQLKIEWDQPVPNSLQDEWIEYVN